MAWLGRGLEQVKINGIFDCGMTQFNSTLDLQVIGNTILQEHAEIMTRYA